MKNTKRIAAALALSAVMAAGVTTGCAGASVVANQTASSSAISASAPSTQASTSQVALGATSATTSSSADGSILEISDIFTDRDLQQEADMENATAITVQDGQDVNITEEGVYVLSGTARDVTITVAADSSSKVQLVLDDLAISNSSKPAIYVSSADKVFITTAAGSTNTLVVTGTFAQSGDDNVDGVIFAKDDIVLNGQGTLIVSSAENGIVGKDDVKVTGGSYQITAEGHGIQGKDSVAIADGTFQIKAGSDGIHAENSDDQTLGYLYIAGGEFSINAGSDGVFANSAAQIDGGTFAIASAEGIEATYVQVNGGTIDVKATDDGINATGKSNAYAVTLEITGGNVSVEMGQGDTDALDSNGALIISGGTVDITAQSAFDYDGQGSLTGGTVTVNGEKVTELMNSMMGGPGQMGNMGSWGSSGGPSGGFSRGSQQSMR